VAEPYVVVDVYRDDFFLRRETIAGLPRVIEIGSDPSCRLWLDSSRVSPVAAQLSVDADGGARLLPATVELPAGAALRLGPFVLVVATDKSAREAGEPGRLLASVPAAMQFEVVPTHVPEPAPPHGSCPRCGVTLEPGELPGSYRSAPVTSLACRACALLVIPPGALAGAHGLAGSAAVRKKKRASGLCPLCRADLQGLVLSWGDDWVSVEECAACGAIVVDRGEIATLTRIGRAARGATGPP